MEETPAKVENLSVVQVSYIELMNNFIKTYLFFLFNLHKFIDRLCGHVLPCIWLYVCSMRAFSYLGKKKNPS